MATIAVAIAFAFALGFTTRAMDNYWKTPEAYRLVYVLLGLAFGVIGFLITAAILRITGESFDPGSFFASMVMSDCLAAYIGITGIRVADWVQEKVLRASPVI